MEKSSSSTKIQCVRTLSAWPSTARVPAPPIGARTPLPPLERATLALRDGPWLSLTLVLGKQYRLHDGPQGSETVVARFQEGKTQTTRPGGRSGDGAISPWLVIGLIALLGLRVYAVSATQ